MDSAEVEEEFSEWEEIENSPRRSQSTPIDANTPPDSPILQPSHRRRQDSPEGRESAGSLSLAWRVVEAAKKGMMKNSAGIFVLDVVDRMRNYACGGRSFWSILVGAVLFGSLVYVKLVRWCGRAHEEKLNHLVLLLKEKDQKIRQLLFQIAGLNELLSSRRRVRVVRIA